MKNLAAEYMRDNPPPHQPSVEREAVIQFIVDIQALESRAHQLGMVRTAHDLNKATNRAGYELADKL